jgi:hypothetical protein
MIDKFKRKMAMLSLALSKVEKSSLNKESGGFDSESLLSQTMNQGTMADALLKGEITTEVKDLRWRTYKVLNESENFKTKISGYDEDGIPITETTTSEKRNLKKVNVDSYDDYEVELVINNEETTKSTYDEISNESLKILKEKEIEEYEKNNDKFDLIGMEGDGSTVGEISFNDMVSDMKTGRSINITRELKPKFEIEEYAKKLVIRNINDESKLLEFYISKYPDEYNRKSRLMLSEVKKISKNPRAVNMLDINGVDFITDRAIGADNGMEYSYVINKFDKIIEHNGHYVLKFLATPEVNGRFIFDKYRQEALEERYRNKESKKSS